MLLQSINLPPSEQQKLRKLLDDGAFDTLLKVVESEAFKHEVEAANHAIGGTSNYDLAAKSAAAKAISIHESIALLKKIRDMKEFTISSAIPNTKPTK